MTQTKLKEYICATCGAASRIFSEADAAEERSRRVAAAADQQMYGEAPQRPRGVAPDTYKLLSFTLFPFLLVGFGAVVWTVTSLVGGPLLGGVACIVLVPVAIGLTYFILKRFYVHCPNCGFKMQHSLLLAEKYQCPECGHFEHLKGGGG